MSGAVEWREEAIARHHDRGAFDCGSAELNDYLQKYARQNHESGGAKSFVAVPPDEPSRVLGYYSISPGAVEFARVPARLTKKLGRYEVPVFRLGRLGVSLSLQGKGLGAELLLAAGVRALSVASQIGGVASARRSSQINLAACRHRGDDCSGRQEARLRARRSTRPHTYLGFT